MVQLGEHRWCWHSMQESDVLKFMVAGHMHCREKSARACSLLGRGRRRLTHVHMNVSALLGLLRFASLTPAAVPAGPDEVPIVAPGGSSSSYFCCFHSEMSIRFKPSLPNKWFSM